MASLSSLSSVQYLRQVVAIGDPVIAGLTDDALDTMLEWASDRLDVEGWGERYREAVSLLTAHAITAGPAGQGGSSAGGPVTSESVGQWSRARASIQLTESNAWLGSTSYGLRFLQLRRTRAARLPFIAR